MKFISLKKQGSSSSYDTMLLHGCGPTFVFNRRELFASMIKQQGLIFWFRFWLSFCFNPGCPHLKKFYQMWPDLKNFINIQIHHEFLEGSVDDAIKFCLDKAIESLKSQSPGVWKAKMKNKTPKAIISDLREFTEMAFGIALCEVFHTWLSAPDITDKSNSYWSIPKQYLLSHFEPEVLEKFLVVQWDDFLLLLLGVNLKEIPWFLKVLYAPECKMNWNDDDDDDDDDCTALIMNENLQSMIEYLKLIRNQRSIKVQVTDESPKQGEVKDDHSSVETQNLSVLTQLIENEPVKSYTYHSCAHCSCVIDLTTFPKYRLCKRCIEENCAEPRHYCNAECQIEHWFLHHHNEHAALLQDLNYQYSFTYVKDSMHSFPFYSELKEEDCPILLNNVSQQNMLTGDKEELSTKTTDLNTDHIEPERLENLDYEKLQRFFHPPSKKRFLQPREEKAEKCLHSAYSKEMEWVLPSLLDKPDVFQASSEFLRTNAQITERFLIRNSVDANSEFLRTNAEITERFLNRNCVDANPEFLRTNAENTERFLNANSEILERFLSANSESPERLIIPDSEKPVIVIENSNLHPILEKSQLLLNSYFEKAQSSNLNVHFDTSQTSMSIPNSCFDKSQTSIPTSCFDKSQTSITNSNFDKSQTSISNSSFDKSQTSTNSSIINLDPNKQRIPSILQCLDCVIPVPKSVQSSESGIPPLQSIFPSCTTDPGKPPIPNITSSLNPDKSQKPAIPKKYLCI
uniref:Uncharacterized protein n=1 Tax=Strigamia maritima TaxID=126957 RepID=T1J362_STRMM